MLGIGVGLAARLQKARERVPECDGSIKLKNNINTFTASDSIEGRVVLTTHTSRLEFIGIWIRFEGIATCRFDTEVDKDRTTHFKCTKFLPDEAQDPEHLEVTFAGKSQRELNRMRSTDVEKVAFSKGVREFFFKIQLDDQNIPSTFQSRFGRIQYKLVLCASVVRGELYFGGKPFWQETVLDEKTLRTQGYLNLSAEPGLCENVIVTRKRDRSFFSKRTLYKVSLILNKKGYLPGEKICGVLVVENPCCEPLQKLQVSFVNKVMYYDQRYNKATLSTLGELENYVETTEPEIRWEFTLDIPINLMPTFRREEKVLEVFYYMQFLVRGTGTQQIKGDTEIVIGTDSKNLNEINNVQSIEDESRSMNNSSLMPDDSHPHRRMFMEQKWDSVAQTSGTLPPSYSNLSSRRSSIATLPPSYEAIFGNGNNCEEPSSTAMINSFYRPRSSSIASTGQLEYHIKEPVG